MPWLFSKFPRLELAQRPWDKLLMTKRLYNLHGSFYFVREIFFFENIMRKVFILDGMPKKTKDSYLVKRKKKVF